MASLGIRSLLVAAQSDWSIGATVGLAAATAVLAGATLRMARSLRTQAVAATRALEIQVEALLVPGSPDSIVFLDDRTVMGGETYRVTPVRVEIENVGNGVAKVVGRPTGSQGDSGPVEGRCIPIAIRGGGAGTIEFWFQRFSQGLPFTVDVSYEAGDGVERPHLQFRCRPIPGGLPFDPTQTTWVIDYPHLPPSMNSV